MEKENNLAFIDGQNLHLGTIQGGWKVDLQKFRVYRKALFENPDGWAAGIGHKTCFYLKDKYGKWGIIFGNDNSRINDRTNLQSKRGGGEIL